VWERLTDPIAGGKLVGITVLLAGFLTAGYLVLYSFLSLAAQEARETRRSL
jgi:hypothetical protein